MAMIASETVGIPYESVSITPYVDTDNTSDTIGTFGSLQTNTGGSGMYEAGLDAKRQLLTMASGLFARNLELEVTAEELDIVNGFVVVKEDPETKLPVSQVVASGGFGASVIGRGRHQATFAWNRIAHATHAAEVEVDTLTGSIKVTKYVAAHDIGKALNPFGLEQQIEGGVTMALGAALTEEMLIDSATGLPLTDNILEYKALSIKDVPRRIDVILVEHAKAYGIYGAHGIGEPVMSPPGPTIGNAVFNAIGVRLTDMPYTRDKVLAAIKSAA
jgi:xanthine dehydrogenase molybdenum-binding subunit